MTIADDVLLPEGTRLVHIGPHKTGTTTLQGAFHAARRAVARQGVLYASTNKQAIQAARAVAGRASPYTGGKVPSEAHWTNLVAQIEGSAAKRVLISAETFADAAPDAIRRVVDDLDPSTVHVVATLRPLARILPSQWQQYVQNGLPLTYDRWLESIFNEPGRAGTPNFWHRHRHDQLIARWAEVAGPDRVTAVIVDDRDHDASLRTFERLLGLANGTLRPPDGVYNRSLTRAETDLIQAMHAASGKLGIDKGLRLNLVLHGGAANMKFRQPDRDEPRTETPAWAQDRVARVTSDIVEGIAASGVRVIGDLQSLREDPKVAEGTDDPASSAAWSASVGRALVGVLIQTGLARGDRAAAGAAWPDDGVATEDEPRSVARAVATWPTSRLTSLVFGRLRSAVPSGLVRPLNLIRRAAMGGGRRRGGRKRGRAQRPSVNLTSRQRAPRRAHELEEAE